MQVFSQLTYATLLASVCLSLIYGFVYVLITPVKGFEWAMPAVQQVIVGTAVSVALFGITDNLELSAMVVIFFAVNALFALLPRLMRADRQLGDAQVEAGRSRRVIDGIEEE